MFTFSKKFLVVSGTKVKPLQRAITPSLLSHFNHARLLSDTSSHSSVPVKPHENQLKTRPKPLLLEEFLRADYPTSSSALPARNLVSKGGGPKSLAFTTALEELEKNLGDLTGIICVAGSSAGSSTALLAVAYHPQEITAVYPENFSNAATTSTLKKI